MSPSNPNLGTRSRRTPAGKSRIAGYPYLRSVIRNWSSRLIARIRESRWLQPLHRLYGPIKFQYVLPTRQAVARLFKPGNSKRADNQYQQWGQWCEKIRYQRETAIRNLTRFSYKPEISIVMPVYETDEAVLREAIDSVRTQYYDGWELCICDDASTAVHIRRVLNEYSALDDRIKVSFSPQNAGIANASNRAIRLATGTFIGLLDHDDKLTPDALYEVVAALQETDFDLIYSDEDRLDANGKRCEPAFKPAWSPDLLLSNMYLAHFCVYRKSIIDLIGGFREGFDGSQDYDLALRFTEKTSRIAHIPRVLYHWRKTRNSASSASAARRSIAEAGKLALTDALHRRGAEAEVECERHLGSYRIRRRVAPSARVSILITTRGSLRLLARCIRSIELKTDHRNYEIVVLDYASRDPAALEYLKGLGHRVIRSEVSASLATLKNIGVRQTQGNCVLFLDDDTAVINTEWLAALLEQALRPEVGAVGAKLLYSDGRIQHAGIVLGIGGMLGNAHHLVNGFTGKGYLNYPNLIRNYSAITGACLMTSRSAFDSVTGFDEEQSSADFCDVDFCLRLQQRNLRIVYTPYARLYHDVPPEHGREVDPDGATRFRSVWRRQWIDDPYYNPNLSRFREDFSADLSKPEALCCVYSHDRRHARPGHLDERGFIGQEFLSSDDHLCAIEVDLEPINKDDVGVVKLHLREFADIGNDVAVVEVVASTIGGKQILFTFDPIRDSAGKTFYFYIESISRPSADCHERLSMNRDASSAMASHRENHRSIQNGASFRVYCLKQFR